MVSSRGLGDVYKRQNIIRTHGEETIARDCFNQNFMSVETMKAIGVDEDDIKVLEPIVKEIERKQSALA